MLPQGYRLAKRSLLKIRAKMVGFVSSRSPNEDVSAAHGKGFFQTELESVGRAVSFIYLPNL